MSVGGEAGVHLSALSEADMRRWGTHNLRCGRLARMAKDSLKSHQSRPHDAAGVTGGRAVWHRIVSKSR